MSSSVSSAVPAVVSTPEQPPGGEWPLHVCQALLE